jgi:hypothetical protein
MRRRHSLNMGVEIRAISANKARGYPHGFRSMSHSTWGACCHCSRSRLLSLSRFRPGNNTGERVASRDINLDIDVAYSCVHIMPHLVASCPCGDELLLIRRGEKEFQGLLVACGERVKVSASVVLILMWLVTRRRRSGRAVKTARSLT